MKRDRTEARIVQLRHADDVPSSAPRRYREGRGYIRLRWKVGVDRYVETYEHRLVMGMPDRDVHHKDGSKSNNDPANLECLSKAEHTRRHWGGHVPRWAYATKRVNAGARERIRREKRLRQVAREMRRRAFVAHLASLYESGLTLVQVARQAGIDHTNVLRALQAAGVSTRTSGDYRPPIDPQLVVAWHQEGVRASEMLRRMPGVGRARLYRVFEQLGLPRFSSGRPLGAVAR